MVLLGGAAAVVIVIAVSTFVIITLPACFNDYGCFFVYDDEYGTVNKSVVDARKIAYMGVFVLTESLY